MDDLTQLMSSLDLISKSIPEGTYLTMCTNIKNIHRGLVVPQPPPPLPPQPPITLGTFYMRPYDIDDDGWSERQAELVCMHEYVDTKRKELSALKFRKNITEVVKRDAIKERAHQMDINLHGRYTIETLRSKGVWIPDERAFYKGYLTRYNIMTQESRVQLEDAIREMTVTIENHIL